VINHERGKDRDVLTTRGTHSRSFVTHIFHNGQPSHCGDRKTFEVMTLALNYFFRNLKCVAKNFDIIPVKAEHSTALIVCQFFNISFLEKDNSSKSSSFSIAANKRCSAIADDNH